jgi:TolB protein
MVSEQPSGAVTFLFTDQVGSTEVLQRLGDDRADALRREHFRLLRESVAARGGREMKTIGDSIMVAFVSAVDAVACAVTMQQAVRGHNEQREEAMQLNVRIGLHVGEPLRDEEDYFGTPVVIARRLCDSASGGQIIASALVRGLVGSRGNFTFSDLGPRDLKGITEPVSAYEVEWEHAVVAARPKTFGLAVRARAAAGGSLLAGGIGAIGLVYFLAGGGDDGKTTSGDACVTAAAAAGTTVIGDIAFVSEQCGKRIRFINTDGSGLGSMGEIPGFDGDLAWSPDGTRLAFRIEQAEGGGAPSTTSGGGGGGGGGQGREQSSTAEATGSSANRDIYVMNIDGTGLKRLTDHPGEDIEPTWSPDSTRIAFTSKRDGNKEIYVMNADGTEQTRLTFEPSDDLHPDWSAGDRIAFVSQRHGDREIYTMTSGGLDQTRITSDSSQDDQPAWSPDGGRIAFTSERDGTSEIYLVNADLSGLVRVTGDREHDSGAAWSPDGNRIAFSKGDPKGDEDRNIYLINVDGSGLQQLTEDDARDSRPVWSPVPN